MIMSRPLTGWLWIAWGALLVLPACKSGSRADDDLFAPPPIVAEAVLTGHSADEQGKHNEHEHGEKDTRGHDDNHHKDNHHTGNRLKDAGAASAPTTEPTSPGPVAVRASLSHAFYSESFPTRLTLKVDLTGISNEASTRRHLNLALVFDRSGSMADDQKYMHAMDAARMVVENLSDRDVISLIVFNQNAVVLSPAGRAVNKDFLYYRLGQFHPEGNTNLSAGLLEAFAQIDSYKNKDLQKQVIVLTDGLANRGVTDPEKLRKLVAAAHARGIGVSTLGCGTKFDENLLTALAKEGGGRYTYAKSSDRIPKAIANELNGLLEVVAQNVKLDVRAVGGTKISRVYGKLIDAPIASQTVSLGDVRKDEKSIFLFDLTPGPFQPGSTAGADVVVTLDDPKTGVRQQRIARIRATYTEDAEQARERRNDSVQFYASILDALERAEEAMQGLDTERFEQAKKAFNDLYKDARKYALKTRDQQLLNQTFLLKHFMAELSAIRQGAYLHSHEEAKRKIRKDIDYRRYLLEHHRGRK